MFHAEIELTNHCNTRCLQCPHEIMSRPRGRMDWTTFTTIIGKIRAHLGSEHFALSFSGMGEPLLNPDIFRFIAHVSPYAHTGFATNGSALTPENVRKLVAAGLDDVYFSFNGDEPALFDRMMGGLSFDRIRSHLRDAIQAANGTRLHIKANVSVTRANRDRLSAIRDLLEAEGVVSTTFSLCHSRGGNLHDEGVFDTPAPPEDNGQCEVLKNTLFVDWRGQVFICDHDIHGEHGLGDLMTEPLEVVLERRRELAEQGVFFKICGECHDLLKFGFYPLESRAGGPLAEWIHDIYRDGDDRLTEATQSMKWIHAIYEKEGRTARLVNRLLVIERTLQAESESLRTEHTSLQGKLAMLEQTVVPGKEDEIRSLRSRLDKREEAHRAERATLRREREALKQDLAHARAELAELAARQREIISQRDHEMLKFDHRLQRIRRSGMWRWRRRAIKLLAHVGWPDDHKD